MGREGKGKRVISAQDQRTAKTNTGLSGENTDGTLFQWILGDGNQLDKSTLPQRSKVLVRAEDDKKGRIYSHGICPMTSD